MRLIRECKTAPTPKLISIFCSKIFHAKKKLGVGRLLKIRM